MVTSENVSPVIGKISIGMCHVSSVTCQVSHFMHHTKNYHEIYIYIFFFGGGGGDKVAELETGVSVTGGLPGLVSNFCCIRSKESLSMYSLDHPGLG